MGPDAARAFMRASNEPAPLFVAENPLRAKEGEVLAELERAKAHCVAVGTGEDRVSGCWHVTPARVLSDGRIRRLIGDGKMLVSDASSQRVANLVLPETEPSSTLEIGAGRGTKTILLEGAAVRRWGHPLASHAAVDNHPFKIELLQRRAAEYGIDDIEGAHVRFRFHRCAMLRPGHAASPSRDPLAPHARPCEGACTHAACASALCSAMRFS